MQEMEEVWVWSLGWDNPLEEGMATHSSILAWGIPWTEEPGGLQSMRLQRLRKEGSDLAVSDLIEVKWSEMKSLSRVRLFATPWTLAYQAPPSLGFSRQEYWTGLPFPSPGDLPNPGIKPGSPVLQADALLSEPPGKSLLVWCKSNCGFTLLSLPFDTGKHS